ncbi:hypothetical protein [Rossellomorea yichunensis]|jgi:hypothetical protein|uniref:hypothetical protein n=1 Tax=Rossellomorea yichunensis TaxID=3077331 RepID=UPI0028DF0796|nr:hypothetical protein [Rossellomorea sp. YC4-1]MDT9025665.1 hypothetical protein [Rossellomorea sp. YC4-1]
MILKGVSGCSGFSYTPKYKQSFIDFFKWIEENDELGLIKYQDVQRSIEIAGGCSDSETRMIVPFMIKAGIINRANCQWRGSRLHKINTRNLFTKSGECFIQFLKIEVKCEEEIENDLAISIIQNIYEKFAKIQFYHLFYSEEQIYKEMVKFLFNYRTMNKEEFFMLCTAMQDNTMADLDNVIMRYRNREFGSEDIEIAYNRNAYTYTSKLLIQYNLFEQRGRDIELNATYLPYFTALIDNVYEEEE